MYTTKNYGALDRFRVAAAILVIAIHTSPLASINESADFFLTRVLARIAVPFFLMVTGQFVAARFLDSPEEGRPALKKFLAKTSLLYAFCILLYLPIGIYAGHYKDMTVGSALRMLVFDGTFYHLWYFPAAILGILLVYLMSRFLSLRIMTIVSFVLYAIGLFGDSYYGIAQKAPVAEGAYEFIFKISSYTRNGLFFAPLFLVMGMWAGEKAREQELREAPEGEPVTDRQELLSDCMGLVFSFFIMSGEAFLLRFFECQRHDSMYLMLIPTMYFLYQCLSAPHMACSRAFRTAATWIYILHPGIIVIVRGAAKPLKMTELLVENSLVHYLCVTLLSVMAGYLIAFIQSQFAFRTDRKKREVKIAEICDLLEMEEQAARSAEAGGYDVPLVEDLSPEALEKNISEALEETEEGEIVSGNAAPQSPPSRTVSESIGARRSQKASLSAKVPMNAKASAAAVTDRTSTADKATAAAKAHPADNAPLPSKTHPADNAPMASKAHPAHSAPAAARTSAPPAAPGFSGRLPYGREGLRAWIELDGDALRHNVDFLRSRLPEGCRLMPAVKAEAYGHGGIIISRLLNQMGIDAFCVACLAEGIALREAGIQGEILILGYTPSEDFRLLHLHQLTQSVVDYEYAKQLNHFGKKLHVHLAIDTGMHRLGIRCENLEELLSVCKMKNLSIDGYFTHLCVSDSQLYQDKMFTESQIQAFYQVIDILRQHGQPCRGLHILASYGILNLLEEPALDELSAPDCLKAESAAVRKKPAQKSAAALHAAEYDGSQEDGGSFEGRGSSTDLQKPEQGHSLQKQERSSSLQKQTLLAADYVRPGIVLYGLLSNKADSALWRSFLRPVLSLKARVSSVRPLYAGEATGYGAAFTAKRNMKIATISIGYADGLPRELSYGKGSVLINGYRAVILGRICMDQTIVDVSRIPRIQAGDIVVIIGRSGSLENTADSLATQCGTITNEFLSRLGGRLDRILLPPQ